MCGSDAAQGKDLVVYDTALGGIIERFGREIACIALFGNAVEYRAEKYVIAGFLALRHFLQAVATCAERADVRRRGRVAVVEVNALQAVFLA